MSVNVVIPLSSSAFFPLLDSMALLATSLLSTTAASAAPAGSMAARSRGEPASASSRSTTETPSALVSALAMISSNLSSISVTSGRPSTVDF